MSVFKCEYCGAQLVPAEDDSVVICGECGKRNVLFIPEEDDPEPFDDLSDCTADANETPQTEEKKKPEKYKAVLNSLKSLFKNKNKKKTVFIAVAAAAAAVMIGVFGIVPLAKYNSAARAYESGDYSAAAEKFAEIIDKRDCFVRFTDAATALGDQLLAEGDEINAAVWYSRAARTIEAEQIYDFNSAVMGYSYVTAGISADGGAYYISDRADDDKLEGLNAVSQMSRFFYGTPGINGADRSGRVILHPLDSSAAVYLSDEMRYALEEETGVRNMLCDTRISDGIHYIVLLKDDGTVKVISDGEKPLTSVEDWSMIKTLKDGRSKIFGIDYSGKLFIAYESDTDEDDRYDITSFPAVSRVVETGNALVGLTLNGRLAVAYANTEKSFSGLEKLKDIADIAVDNDILAVTFRNGSVKAFEVPNWISDGKTAGASKIRKAVKEISSWKNIVRIRFASGGVYGIRYDGTAEYVSTDIRYNAEKEKYVFSANRDIAKQVKGWTDIVDVIPCVSHAVGVRSDGTLVSAGSGDYLSKEYIAPDSDAYTFVKTHGGVYTDVSEWTLW